MTQPNQSASSDGAQEKLPLVCAWCNSFFNLGQWLPENRRGEMDFSRGITHGICPDCLKKTKSGAIRL